MEPNASSAPLLIRPPSHVLLEAWPRLRERYRELLDHQGNFPLFTKQQIKNFDREKPKEDLKTPLSTTLTNASPSLQRQAAVLVLLCTVSGTPSILLTRRASHMNAHPSQFAFVGGHFDSQLDATLGDTALREAQEELAPSIPSFLQDYVQVLGQTAPLPSINGTPVTPVLAVLWSDLVASSSSDCQHLHRLFPGNPAEVDLVFTVALKDLIQGETRRPLTKGRFHLTEAPFFPTEHGEIWGLTAYILSPLLQQLYQPVFGGE
jgi:8-oxo-dGTP pyrophosphatase MutT (NUDIX family)